MVVWGSCLTADKLTIRSKTCMLVKKHWFRTGVGPLVLQSGRLLLLTLGTSEMQNTNSWKKCIDGDQWTFTLLKRNLLHDNWATVSSEAGYEMSAKALGAPGERTLRWEITFQRSRSPSRIIPVVFCQQISNAYTVLDLRIWSICT